MARISAENCPVAHSPARPIARSLLLPFNLKQNQLPVIELHMKPNRVAADFTILDIVLFRDRSVQQHGNLFPANRGS